MRYTNVYNNVYLKSCLFAGAKDHFQRCSPSRVSYERQWWWDGCHHPYICREFREGPRETQQRDTGKGDVVVCLQGDAHRF